MVSDHIKIGYWLPSGQDRLVILQYLFIAITTSKPNITEYSLGSRNYVGFFPFTAAHCVNPYDKCCEDIYYSRFTEEKTKAEEFKFLLRFEPIASCFHS